MDLQLFDNAIMYLASNEVELGLVLLQNGAVGTPEEVAAEVEKRFGETLRFVNRYAKESGGKKLPEIEWWGLMGLQTLHLSNNQLTSIPDLSGLANLQWLNLYNNHLTSIPALAGLSKLQTLDLGNNQLTSIPDLSGLANLQRLHLYNNHLTSIPDFTGLAKLQRLNLYNNHLTTSQL